MVNLRAPLLAALPAVAAQNSTLWDAQSAPSYPSPWGQGLGDWADAYASARKFVSGLTLVEKVNLTTGVGWQGELCVGNTGSIPRVGFKALCNEDSPLGVRDTDFNSAFSAGVTIAATWDRALLRQRGYDMATEHKMKGVDTQLGPVVGPLGRAPEGGRNWEGFAPDPVLSGIAVAETIKGMQSAGVMACTKHYILNEQEHFRQGAPPAYLKAAISSNIDDVAMHELYLWPFADAVRAGTASIMCSYNQVNNSYACQNSHNLNYLLKNELGFQGFVMSDWSAQHSGVSSALAGLDMTMPGDIAFNTGTSYWGTNLTIAVLNGTVPQWRLDDMAVRIMAAWYYVDREANQVENAPNFSAWTLDTEGYQHHHVEEGYGIVNYHVNVQGNHGQHIRNAAAKGTVLLKNTGGLPLTGNEQLTAIFGEDATQNAWGVNGCGDRACDNGTLAMGWGSGTANFPYLITPAEAIRSEVLGRNNGVSVEAVVDDYAYDQIDALANRVGNAGGVCLVFANSDSGEGYLTVDGNEGDRNNLTLWHSADQMIANVTSYCNNTVVVLHTVGAVLVDSFYQNPNVTAIVWAGLPGQESGNSIVDVLYGKVNPGGKTPFTWGPSRESYGTDVMYVPNNGVNAPQQNFDEGIFIDYRGFDKHNITPIYEFGFGLSYTSFSFSNLNVQSHSVPAYEPTTGMTSAAPTYGTIDMDPAEYVFPEGHNRVYEYIYPWLNSTSLSESSGDPLYGEEYQWPEGSSDGSAQPYLAAGSNMAPGGNAALYDVMFTVTAQVTNTGKVQGDEVPQMYVSLGGPNDAKVVLRNFDRITIEPGQSATFKADITRRDLSNWDTAAQDWLISSYPKTVYVGNSSRNLPLRATLNMSGGSGGSGSGYPTGPGGGSGGPSYGNPAGGPASGGAATQIGDGQVQAPGAATQIGDGQVQAPAPATQIGDGQVQAPAPATQIGDGQVQAPAPATQIGDGQVQAPSPVNAATQIGDGQVQAPAPATQIGDGQVQAPSPAPGAATQIGDGQVQAPAPATQIGDGQVQAPSPAPPSY